MNEEASATGSRGRGGGEKYAGLAGPACPSSSSSSLYSSISSSDIPMNQVPIEQFEAFEAALNNDIISQEHSIPLGKDDATITVITSNNDGNSHDSLNKNTRLENIVDRVQARINEKAVDHFKDEDKTRMGLCL